MKGKKCVYLILGEVPSVLYSIDLRNFSKGPIWLTPDMSSLCQSHYRINDEREFLDFCKNAKASPKNNVKVGFATALCIFDFRGIAKIRALFRGPDGTRRVLINLMWHDQNTLYYVTYLLPEEIFQEAVSVVRKGSTTTGGFSPHVGLFPDCYVWNVGEGRFTSI